MIKRFQAGLAIIFIAATLIFATQLLAEKITSQPSRPEVESAQFVPTQGLSSDPSPVPTRQTNYEKATVKRVVDGDTIVLTDGRTVRYIGIDTPETVHPKKLVQCFGQEASATNKALVAGQEVWLEKDVSEMDRYQRLLRYVYIASSESSALVMVNEKLVADGLAYASSYPPDIKYQLKFSELEYEARRSGRGLWGVAGCARE